MDTSQRDVVDDGWIIWSDGMIGLFSLCWAQDRVVRPQNHITPSAPGGMIEALQIEPHCIVSC